MKHEIKESMRPIFVSSDGREFGKRRNAICHQARLDAEQRVDDYIMKKHDSSKPRHKQTLKRTLIEWEVFKALQDAGLEDESEEEGQK